MADLIESRAALVQALKDDLDPPIVGIDELGDMERRELIVMCAATVIAFEICHAALYKTDFALEGVAALFSDMRERVCNICAEHRMSGLG